MFTKMQTSIDIIAQAVHELIDAFERWMTELLQSILGPDVQGLRTEVDQLKA